MQFSPDRVGVFCFVLYLILSREKKVFQNSPHIYFVQYRREKKLVASIEYRLSQEEHTLTWSPPQPFFRMSRNASPGAPRTAANETSTPEKLARVYKRVTPFVSRVFRASCIRNGPFNSAST